MSRPSGHQQRAPQRGALFVCWLLCWVFLPAPAAECLAFRADEQVNVRHVYDGDTVELVDGRKVRLIGINSPEIGYDGTPSEPLAQEARQALVEILAGNPALVLQYEQEKQDRYGRTLAHLYLADQTNVQKLMIRRGLAAAVAVAPNVANFDCYLQEERKAFGQGIWRQARFQGVETSALAQDASGFYLLKGKVIRVGESRKAYWLNFPGKVAARISKRHLDHFDQRLEISSLQGKMLRVRGWIYPYRDEKRLDISVPEVIEVLD